MAENVEYKRHPVWVARTAVGVREGALKRMTVRHANERAQKEQELIAARADLERLEREYPEYAK